MPELYNKINDYENLAIKLGNDKSFLNKIKNKLRQILIKNLLFNSIKFTKDLENIYKNC